MNIKGFYYLYLKEIKRFLIVWGQTLLTPLITSLLFLFVFSITLGTAKELIYFNGKVIFIEFLIPGLIMMQVLQNSFGNSSSSILMSKVFGTFNDILAAPLSNNSIVLAYILAAITRGIITAIIIFIVCSIASMHLIPLDFKSIVIAIYFLIISSFILGAIGLICGLWASNFDRMSTITSLIITPLSFLSGTFYSVDRLPEYVRYIINFNPIFYMIDGFRFAFIHVSDFNVLLEAIILFILAVVLYVISVILIKSGYNTRS